MRKTIVVALICAAAVANAANLLWKVDIIGGSYLDWEGVVVDKGMTFTQYFESYTIPGKAASKGIDIIAKTSSGDVLPWLYVGNPSFEYKYGPWLEKEESSGWSYVAIAVQLVLDRLSAGDSIQIFAGYFDWDNLDYSLEIDEAKFTPFAVSVIAFEDIPQSSTYCPGDIAPSNWSRIYQWNSVPEPSIISLFVLGVLAFFAKRRKRNDG